MGTVLTNRATAVERAGHTFIRYGLVMLTIRTCRTSSAWSRSRPGMGAQLGRLSGAARQFVLKDVVLLGAALWSLGESLPAEEA